jgi:uncharacterized protein (DUF342 family)
MNLLKNYTTRDEKEFTRILVDRYDLDPSEFIVSRDEKGRIVAKIVTTEKSVDGVAAVNVSKDGLKALLEVCPPINEGSPVSGDTVMEILQEENITVNINRDAIDNAVRLGTEGGVSENIIIAEGVEPINGKNSQIMLNFEPIKNKPKILKNGSVDYKNIDNIRLVQEGDLLLSKKPATAGVRGLSVRNEEIPAEAGVDTDITVGEGVRIEKDGTEYYAMTDGCVSFKRNTLEVSPVYSVRGSVDYSTGNITFNGSVHVKFDVLSDFKIKAEKDIYVDGICQDAHLEAGGNIIIKMGIKGDGKGSVKANGDIFVGYAENANIEAKGNIEIQKYSYSSVLRAGGRIEALKEPGVIAGGEASAFEEICVNQAGTVGNSKFSVNVGTKFFFERELNALKATKDKYLENKAKIDEFLGSVDLKNKEVLANPKVRQLINMRKQIDTKLKSIDEEMKNLIKEAHHPRPKFKVKNDLHEGLDIQIYREKITVRQSQKNVVYYFEDKYQEIKSVSLEDQDWQNE